ncbi:putative triacylglycerol lipase [Teratosphaeria destructans]|uniref:Carboxylic ester hydrolase n=1 Tax=Teratosphaeria destructans TaxID=418781 RepID=A0A9W7W6U3_9PEZI|nr:putative triacylglycerol lipase [Teratosphaeria destructans]
MFNSRAFLTAAALVTCSLAIQQSERPPPSSPGPDWQPYGPPPWSYSHNSSVVALDYATYSGQAYRNGVSAWLGIRYAAPPLGPLRFAAPVDPPQFPGVQNASQHGPICLPTPGSATNFTAQSEDCLFLDVYAPTNATATGQRLPVYFFIQGGGFSTNSNPNYNGSGLIQASGYNIVVVSINYRVGPYGFLASREVQDGGSINNGLKDQRKALEWVNKYIEQFGGDPNHVTIGGDSAGAQSVNLQVTAYGGRDDGLFQATAAESQPSSGLRSVAESQYNYDNLVIRTGCSSWEDTLACLRSLNVTDLQTQNILTPFPNAMKAPLYPYGPTLDNDFIQDYTAAAYASGRFVRVPAIGGDDTNEGTIFVPRNTSTVGEANTFVRDQSPTMTPARLWIWNQYYTPQAFPNFGSNESLSKQGAYFQALAVGHGEQRYICTGIYISAQQARYRVPNWNYRWNVIDPAAQASGSGVTHTIEINAIWGPMNTNGGAPGSYYAGEVNGAIVPVVQAYWTSFIRTYNPNTYRLPGTPLWEAWGVESAGYQRLMFQTNATAMEDVPQAQQERCAWFASIAPGVER